MSVNRQHGGCAYAQGLRSRRIGVQGLRSRRIGHKRHCGFTLVEVLVALIVVAVALPALLSQVMTQVDGTAALRDKTIAHWVAQNQWTRLQLERRLTGVAPKAGGSGEVEMLDRNWQWKTEVTATTELVRTYTISVGPQEMEPLVVLEGALDH